LGLIYAVDDVPELTELYTTLLEAAGYIVRAFNDRAEAWRLESGPPSRIS
jgi:CheY-like chemotaxis protein